MWKFGFVKETIEMAVKQGLPRNKIVVASLFIAVTIACSGIGIHAATRPLLV